MYTSNWIEPDQLNAPNCFLLSQMWRWVYLSLFQACWKQHCLLFLIPGIMPLRLFDTVNINGIGATPGAVSPLIPPALAPQQAQHETALSSRLKVLSALISYMALCYGLDCWIPLDVTVVNISFSHLFWKAHILVQKSSQFLPLCFSLPLLREGNRHQRHSALLTDVPRMPCSQGNHLK